MRTLVACSIGAAVGIFTFAIAVGFAGSWAIAAVAAVFAAGLIAWALRTRPVIELDQAACSRGLKIVAAVATIAALVQLARLAVFMADQAQPAWSTVPASDWEVRHSCVSAYFVAARAASRVPDVYADSLYSLPDDDPSAIRKARMIGPFKIDVYEYPPPFLLLPRALRLVVPDFMRFRAMWFGLNSVAVLIALLVLARSLGPAAGTRALLLSPLVWAALPTLSLLQKGNVQALMIAISLLAMALFESRRWAAGGLLLAYATVSKLFPGLLVVYLLCRRQWRAAAWTSAFCIALAVLTLMDTGRPSYSAFVRHLPGLLGGEAFPAFRNPMAMAINYSVPGIIFKLHLFGLPGMNFATSKLVGWIYTLFIIVVIAAVAGRPIPGASEAWWLAFLIPVHASPFLAADFAGFPLSARHLAADVSQTPKDAVAVLASWRARFIGGIGRWIRGCSRCSRASRRR
jgi:hypothetical protein